MDKPKVIIVIPARWESKRLPGKMLADIGGVPLITRVVNQVERVKNADKVIVATDNSEIASMVQTVHVSITSPDCRSGSDRVAEVMEAWRGSSPHDLVVNVQGDMPFVPPELIEDLIEWSLRGPGAVFGINTPAIDRGGRVPDAVKVIRGGIARVIAFVRPPLPKGIPGLDHIGIYAYRWAILQAFTAAPQPQMEIDAGLEQLRAISAGLPIGVMETDIDCGPEVNTPEDLEDARVFALRDRVSRDNHTEGAIKRGGKQRFA